MILDLFGAPWLITEGGLKSVINIASRDSFFSDLRKDALEARNGAPLKNSRAVTVRGSVAVIPVNGALIRHADMFSDISGATSYAALRKDLQVALDDRSVSSILFLIDSPGGEANGCFEFADSIFAARKIKPIRAYVGGMGASAAYAIACACEDITCAASAELGSIGVRAGYLDDSAAMESIGLKEWTFVSSQSPHKAFDVTVEDDRARLQVVLDDLAEVFVGLVARGRDVSVETVLEKFGKGDVMVGARAVAAGLADQLGDFESLLADMNQYPDQPDALRVAAMENRMKTTASATPAVAASIASEKCDGCDSDMSSNSKSYCAKCYGDDEEDDEECAALGIEPKSNRAARLKRAAELNDFHAKVLSASQATSAQEALGRVASSVTAASDLAVIRAELATEKSAAVRRDLRTVLEAGLEKKKLSLGSIQKSIPLVLRGEQKAAWDAAFAEGKLEKVTKDTVLDAACSIAISSDDLAAISEFAKSSAPIAAEEFIEPARDPKAEGDQLDATAMEVKKHADAARATLDRGKKSAAAKK